LEYSQLAKRDRVHSRDTLSVKYWLTAWPSAISDEEVRYLDQDDDLIYVTEKTGGVLSRGFSDLTEGMMPCFRRRLKEEELGFLMGNVILHKSDGVNKLLIWVLMVIGLATLIIPLWLLHLAATAMIKLAIITAFIVVFFVSVSIATNARPIESLGATAAYVLHLHVSHYCC
jgi:hypothetical protein